MAANADDIELSVGSRDADGSFRNTFSRGQPSSTLEESDGGTSAWDDSDHVLERAIPTATVSTAAEHDQTRVSRANSPNLRQRLRKRFGKESRLRKWEFYERLCTLPKLSIAMVTCLLSYRTLVYLHYQSTSLFRADCIAMREANLTLSPQCSEALKHSMQRPGMLWGRALVSESNITHQLTLLDFLVFSEGPRSSREMFVASQLIVPGLLLWTLDPLVFSYYRFDVRRVCFWYAYYSAFNLTGVWIPAHQIILLLSGEFDEHRHWWWCLVPFIIATLIVEYEQVGSRRRTLNMALNEEPPVCSLCLWDIVFETCRRITPVVVLYLPISTIRMSEWYYSSSNRLSVELGPESAFRRSL